MCPLELEHSILVMTTNTKNKFKKQNLQKSCVLNIALMKQLEHLCCWNWNSNIQRVCQDEQLAVGRREDSTGIVLHLVLHQALCLLFQIVPMATQPMVEVATSWLCNSLKITVFGWLLEMPVLLTMVTWFKLKITLKTVLFHQWQLGMYKCSKTSVFL